MILYSISPYGPVEKGAGRETFHEYEVLGKVEVTDPAQKRQVAAAIRAGIAESDGKMMKCFDPRHGLRIVDGGQVTEYLICFQCRAVQVHQAGGVLVATTTPAPQELFDAVLTAAGVPLAPKEPTP